MKQKIDRDFIVAMKARDRQRADALKMLRSAIKQVEVDERKVLSDQDVEKILRGELKKRKEAAGMYQQGGRQDLVDKEMYEAKLIESYLPEQMGREEVVKIVGKIVSEMSGANFGQVMGKVMMELKGRADGKLVQEVVKQKL